MSAYSFVAMLSANRCQALAGDMLPLWLRISFTFLEVEITMTSTTCIALISSNTAGPGWRSGIRCRNQGVAILQFLSLTVSQCLAASMASFSTTCIYCTSAKSILKSARISIKVNNFSCFMSTTQSLSIQRSTQIFDSF